MKRVVMAESRYFSGLAEVAAEGQCISSGPSAVFAYLRMKYFGSFIMKAALQYS